MEGEIRRRKKFQFIINAKVLLLRIKLIIYASTYLTGCNKLRVINSKFRIVRTTPPAVFKIKVHIPVYIKLLFYIRTCAFSINT